MKIAIFLISFFGVMVVVFLLSAVNELIYDTKQLYKYREIHLNKINSLERKINSLERDMKDLDESFDRLGSSYVRLERRVYGPMEKPKSPKSFKTGLVGTPIPRKQENQQVIRKKSSS